MKARAITITIDPSTGMFDDEALASFCDNHNVLSVADHFFVHDGQPTLLLVVYFNDQETLRVPGRRRGRRAVPDLGIANEDLALFDALRKWRNKRAEAAGRPAFVLFTNAQLAAIAHHRPTTNSALQSIEGVGEARVRDYGEAVLVIVAKVPKTVKPQPTAKPKVIKPEVSDVR